MKKDFKRKVCSLISLVMLTTITFTSCSSCSSCNFQKDNEVKKVRYTGGIHNLTATETDKWLLKDGQTEYKILLPNDSGSLVFAKDELIERFYEATGARLVAETENETGTLHSENAKYISLGNTKMFESAGLTLDAKVLGNDGVRIVTKDNTIYINGGKKNGVLYGVYDFLQIYFDYDYYYDEFYAMNTGVTELKLLNFDVTDVPDVEIRVGSNGYATARGTAQTRSRFRYNYPGYAGSDGVFMIGHTGHNTSKLINQNTEGYEIYSADWMSDNGNQLCYTAHGNEESYNEMVTQIAKKFSEDIIANAKAGKESIDMSITIEDNTGMCSCQACVAVKEKYGAYTSAVIMLCNNVMHEVKDVWMNSEEGLPYKNEAIRCSFFAYQQIIDPPDTVFNEKTGLYEMAFEELEMREDVGVWLCFTKPYDRGISFYSDKNAEFREWFTKWSDISSFMHTWGYAANFANYVDFTNSFDFYSSDLMQFCVDKGIKMWWTQNTGTCMDATAFNGLKEYLQSKLTWDCTFDVDELMNKYFAAMYGEAAEVMREYFDFSKQIATQLFYETGGTKMTWNSGTAKHQPYAVLRKKMAYCDEALSIVENIYKEKNPEKYNQYKFNIDLEWISPVYHLMGLHSEKLSIQEYNAIGRRWYEAQKVMDKITSAEQDSSATGIFGVAQKFAP